MSPQDSPSSHERRARWDQRYHQSDAAPRPPDAFLMEAFNAFIHPAFPHAGDALDVAGGSGRHALHLAERGWRVTLTDISQAGLAKAQAAARQSGLSLRLLLGDTRQLDFGAACFDLALGFFYLDRPTLPKIARALRPGGLVIYQTFTSEHRKFATFGATKPSYFLRPQELRQAFPDFELLFYEEGAVASPATSGLPLLGAATEPGLARLVARKRP